MANRLPTSTEHVATRVLAVERHDGIGVGSHRAAQALLLPACTALLAYGVFADGAFFWPQARILTVSILVAAAIAAPLALRQSWAVLGASAILAIGLVVSAWVNGWPPQTVGLFATVGIAAGFFVTAAGVVLRGQRDQLLEAMCWLSALVAAGGFLGLSFHAAPWALWATEIWRDSSALGYANATALAFVMMLPAGILLAARKPSLGARLALYMNLVGFLSTLSRGGALAAVAMVASLLFLGHRSVLRPLARPLAGALVALAGVLPSASGNAFPVPALGCLVAGGVVAALPPAGIRRAGGRRIPIPVLAAIASTATLAGLLVLSRGLRTGLVLSRWHLLGDARIHTWTASLGAALAHPVFGTGPGTFGLIESGSDGTLTLTRYAHNEWIHALFETGMVGVLCLLGALLVLCLWAIRRRRTADPLVWAAAFSVSAAFVAQGTVDFVWHFPALIAVAFTWLAIGTVVPRSNGLEEGS